MGQETLGVVRDGSGDHWVGLGWVGGPTWRLCTGWGTLKEVRDGSRYP